MWKGDGALLVMCVSIGTLLESKGVCRESILISCKLQKFGMKKVQNPSKTKTR